MKAVHALGLGMLLTLCLRAPARSEPTGVTILASTPAQLGADSYVEVKAMMHGTAPGGDYSVPVTLLYPAGGDCNGTAIVDFFNYAHQNVFFVDASNGAVLPYFPPIQFSRIALGDSFLAGRRYVHMAVHWDQASMLIAHLAGHPLGGFISARTDGYQIVADAVNVVKDPPSSLPGLCASARAVAFGHGATTHMLRQYLLHEIRNVPRTMEYDGFFLDRGFPVCMDLATDDILGLTPCADPLPDDLGKIMAIETETEVMAIGAFQLRGESSTYRHYEIAGASHVPSSFVDAEEFWRGLGFDLDIKQNPVEIYPALRAFMEHLRRWMEDAAYEPPPSEFLGDVAFVTITPFGIPLFELVPGARDADGNALGGVRLPHLRTLTQGRAVGAPFARQSGVDFEFSLFLVPPPYFLINIFNPLLGRWEPFDDARIQELDPSRGAYVAAVAKGAEYALEQGWILEEDKDRYIEIAASGCEIGAQGKTSFSTGELLRCLGYR